MKQRIAIALVFCAVCYASLAVIIFTIDAPEDERDVRAVVGRIPELQPLHDEYFDIIKTRLWPLKFSEMEKIFGRRLETNTNWWGRDPEKFGRPKLDHFTPGLVLPVFATAGTNGGGVLGMMVSGLHTGDPIRDKSHTDLYAVGDIGYVEFYSQLDGETVQAAAIYLRADKNFVPLKSGADYPARLRWERSKFEALKMWFDAHLAPIKGEKKSPPN